MRTSLHDDTRETALLRPSLFARNATQLGSVLLASAAACCALTLLLRGREYWVFTLDDAYITLRYAKHLAQGAGITWNPLGPPAEGYTSALWLLWLALAECVGIGLLVAKASGGLFTFGALLLAAKLCDELTAHMSRNARRIGAAVPFLMGISYWPLALHAVSGMETGMSLLTITLVFFSAARVLAQPSTARLRLFAIAQLLASLARPEAALVCAATSSVCLVQLPRAHRARLLRALVLLMALPGALYFAVRYAHYGLLFPLSFYVKAQGQAPLAGLPDVIDFFRPFLSDAVWWLVPMPLCLLASKRILPALAGGLTLVVFFVFPAHIMAFEGRYLLPLFPLLTVITGTGVALLAERASSGSRPWLSVLLAAGVALASTWPFPGHPQERAARWLAYGNQLNQAHVALAHDLERFDDTGTRRIALLDVGAVGYFADWFTIDTFGLNDAQVALSQRHNVDYVFGQRPDLLVVVSKREREFSPVFDWETALHQRAVSLGFRYLCAYQFEADYYLQLLSPTADSAELCRSARDAP